MTKNLTEVWKNGELEDGDYYVKTRQGIIIIDYFDVDEFSYDTNHYVEEVLAPVPSYEEWQELSKQRNKLIRDVKDLAYIQEENAKLKELLKEWVKFYPIVLYEYEDTLKTKDIIELREKTVEVLK